MKAFKYLSIFCIVTLLVACTPNEEIEDKKVESLGSVNVKMEIQDYGVIMLELDGDSAPISVANFVSLVERGFYDGLTMHRIIPDFVVQGGGPNGSGKGEDAEKITGEFSDNGIENNIKHVRGVISMARANSYDSGSSQFFIMHKDNPSLDGKYAAFGRVTSGMEVVDAICEKANPVDDNGTIAKSEQPVITSITIVK